MHEFEDIQPIRLFVLISRPIWLLFHRWFAHLCFGLGRGPTTPPGPAMVLMDRKDVNLNKTETKIFLYSPHVIAHPPCPT